ncbi:MAG: VanW family protein [Bacteroidetes bacterium]|nr:VanW family protein [Bacteroidota bacterium]
MTSLKILTEKHNLLRETKFQLKSFLLIIRRQIQNTFANTKKFSDKGQLKALPIISVSESNLWNIDDNEQNWILTAGKVQNLRLAAKRLNGIEVEANKPFSLWKHLGNPNIGQGYVIGREIREGCIVPTIAGGLCQLSNALYDAALKANFEIIERHRHTKVIKGSLAEQDRDATVKWNYVDLRFKSTCSFRIEIDITTDKLIVKFRSSEKIILLLLQTLMFYCNHQNSTTAYRVATLSVSNIPTELPSNKKEQLQLSFLTTNGVSMTTT